MKALADTVEQACLDMAIHEQDRVAAIMDVPCEVDVLRKQSLHWGNRSLHWPPHLSRAMTEVSNSDYLRRYDASTAIEQVMLKASAHSNATEF